MRNPFIPVCWLLILTAAVAVAQNSAPQVAAQAPTYDLSQFRTADALWAHIQGVQAYHAPDRDGVAAAYRDLIASTGEFQNRYPNDPRRWNAALLGVGFNYSLQKFTGNPDTSQAEGQLRSIAASLDAPPAIKESARVMLIHLHIAAAPAGTMPPDLEDEIIAFARDFPQSRYVATFQQMRMNALEKSDPSRAAELRACLQSDPNAAVAAMARGESRAQDIQKQPLDLRFTALDGSPIDLANLRGKVVIVDFWATWCGPCMREVPEVVQAYNDLHARGLEVVGISLDQDRARVETVTRAEGMVWPQYFDGRGWQNQIATTYDIRSIPRMWLINKQGVVVDANLERGTLEQRVGKLLEE